ncbi:MAG: hypothetical protein AAFV29_01475, partial [Myxococcota bacterium]
MVDLQERLGSHNLAFVEELYAQFCEDPNSVDPDWRSYFASMESDGPGPVRIGPSFGVRSIFNPASNGSNGHARAVSSVPAAGPVDAAAVEARVPYLQSLTMFKDLGGEELAEAARIAQPLRFDDGEVFVREGEMGHDLYVITEGQVVIRRAGRVIAELGPGEV